MKRFYFCQPLVPLSVSAVCDWPIPNCGARYLVKLPNYLTDVHQLDYSQRRKWELQEAKLQLNVRVVIYRTKTNQGSEESPSKPQEGNDTTVYQLSTSRKGIRKTSVETLRKGIRKARNRIKRCNNSKVVISGLCVGNWSIMDRT